MSTSPNPVQAFAEISPHSIQLAVISGRRLVALRSFSLEAKTAISAFVNEFGVSGTIRSSLMGDKRGLIRSASAESTSGRSPAALLAHAASSFKGLENPVATAVDSAHGTQPDLTQTSHCVICAVDGHTHSQAKQTLGELGLAPVELTLAPLIQLGCVASSLSKEECALVILLSDEQSDLVWITAQGVQHITSAPIGYLAIYDAIQSGVGLKFKAAASKLFYNENYDFGETASKIGDALAALLKPSLAGTNSVNLLHIAGLTYHQAWLIDALAKSLSLDVWGAQPEKVAFGLDCSGIDVNASSVGALRLAVFGSNDGPWVQAPLDVIAARPVAPPNNPVGATSAPISKPASKNPAAQINRPVVAAAKSSAKAAPGPKPVSTLNSDKVKSSSQHEAPDLMAADAVAVQGAGKASLDKKNNKVPFLIGGGVGAVALAVGLSLLVRSPSSPPASMADSEGVKGAKTAIEAGVDPAVTPAVATSSKPPAISAVPAPAPTAFPASSNAVVTNSTSQVLSSDLRNFSNQRYRFEITEKGFIQALSNSREEVLLESAAGISLQGSYVGTDGRRKWFNVGGVDDAGYKATVSRTLSNGITIFNVNVAHPRFQLTQTFECHPESIKVTSKFTPINLRDPRGVISAVHSVRIASGALNPSIRMRAAVDSFTYAMKTGTLRVAFDNLTWARDGADGKQTIIAGENSIAFHFTDSQDAASNSLKYEIMVP